MTLPDTIRLGPRSIPVQYTPLEDEYGLSRELPPLIQIDSSVDQRTQAQTLLHEVLHHVSWLYGLDWGERKVRLLEVVLVDLVQLNPDLFRALLEAQSTPTRPLLGCDP